MPPPPLLSVMPRSRTFYILGRREFFFLAPFGCYSAPFWNWNLPRMKKILDTSLFFFCINKNYRRIMIDDHWSVYKMISSNKKWEKEGRMVVQKLLFYKTSRKLYLIFSWNVDKDLPKKNIEIHFLLDSILSVMVWKK